MTPDIPDFDSVARRLSGALERYFPAARGVELIAEPGRFLVDSSCTLHVCVIARKGAAGKTSSPMYFVNDSIYSSFNCIMYDHATVVPEVCCTAAAVPPRCEWNGEASLWGQTCDGLDCILERVALPSLEVGDWLHFRNMGAYTSCAASQFNGFSLPDRFYCDL